MTNEHASNPEAGRRRGRKPYPTLRFERVLELPKAIDQYGVEGRIRRLTLFQQMERSPGSSSSRTLITTSARYGLTTGSYQAEHLELTDTGKAVVSGDPRGAQETIRTIFNQAIMLTSVFGSVYERLKNERIPTTQVLQDLLAQEGVDESDCEEAAIIFIDNMRFVGVIKEHTGNEYIIPLEQLLEELPEVSDDSEEGTFEESAQVLGSEVEIAQTAAPTLITQPTANNPTLHIDIQIHIDSSASAEQIDQIFSSMAKHLYGRGE